MSAERTPEVWLPHHDEELWKVFVSVEEELRKVETLRKGVILLSSLAAERAGEVMDKYADARHMMLSTDPEEGLDWESEELVPGGVDAMLKAVVDSALKLPLLFPPETPLGKLGFDDEDAVSSVVVLDVDQVYALMSAAFLGLFPPEQWSFKRIFSSSTEGSSRAKACGIVHYLARVGQRGGGGEEPKGVLRWERVRVPKDGVPNWAESGKRVGMLEFENGLCAHSDGSIEDDGEGMLQADFANARLGGGVLGRGCVQEEIRVGITNPQLLVGLLLAPDEMQENEVILMSGSERFSDYEGYGRRTVWGGPHTDGTFRDPESGSFATAIVAFDALPFPFTKRWNQFSKRAIDRELLKAYAAFLDAPNANAPSSIPIATGNWGCGAFGGHIELKVLIQVLAGAQARRPIAYFTFGRSGLAQKVNAMARRFSDLAIAVSELYVFVVEFVVGSGGADGLIDAVLAWDA